MLGLKCSICLEVLKTLESVPMAAPCGHIYCQACLYSISRTREKSNCALCRQPFPINAVIKLFVEFDETPLAPAPPLTGSQKEIGKAVLEACKNVRDNAGENEALQTIVSAEKLLLSMEETHGDTGVKDLLNLVNASLREFRQRLKLFSRMNALQQKNAELEQERDSLRHAVIGQLKEAEEAAQTRSGLERRLKRAYANLEMIESRERRERDANFQAVREMSAKLQSERATSAKYRKKCYVTLQQLKNTRVQSRVSSDKHLSSAAGPLNSETEVSDDSLEIMAPFDSPRRPDTDIKASLRRQISSSSSTGKLFDDPKDERRAAVDDAGLRISESLKRRSDPCVFSALSIVREESGM